MAPSLDDRSRWPAMKFAYSLVSPPRLEEGTADYEEERQQKGWNLRTLFTTKNILLGFVFGVFCIFFFAAIKATRHPPLYRPSSETGLTGYEILQAATASSAMHHQQAPDFPKLCVIARTYGAQFSYVPIFLLSLWHGGFPNIQVFLLNTDTSMKTSEMQEAVKLVNSLVGNPDYASFLDWELTTSGDYGYALTDRALLYLYHKKQRHFGCEYLMVSNGDNVYTQGFANYLKPGMEKGAELLGFDFVSHHQWWDYRSTFDGKAYIDSAGSLVCRPVEFRTNFIDLGAAMFKFSTLRDRNMTFIGTGEYGWRSDGHFIEAVNAVSGITFTQHSTLLLHQ